MPQALDGCRTGAAALANPPQIAQACANAVSLAKFAVVELRIEDDSGGFDGDGEALLQACE